MISHLIFDLDGTLVDSSPVCVEILNSMLRDRGSHRVINPDDARPLMSKGGEQMVSTLLGSECYDPAEDLKLFRTRYRQVPTPPETLFGGVAAGLEALRAMGMTLSICSNKPQSLCEQVLNDTGIANLFSVVVGGQADKNPKPAPDLMLTTLEKLQVDAEHCCYVGDSELDHIVAGHFGMPFLFVTYGYQANGWTPDDSACFDCFPSMVQSLTEQIAVSRAA